MKKVSPAVTQTVHAGIPDADPDAVISALAGHVELRDATATFNDFRFTVPGASAHMHGTYNLETLAIDLHGTLKTDEEFSGLTTGFKSVILKPFNVFFRKKHAGAVLPVHLAGTYKKPEPGLDLPREITITSSMSLGVSSESRNKPKICHPERSEGPTSPTSPGAPL